MKYILIALLLLSFNASASTELIIERTKGFRNGACKITTYLDDVKIASIKNGKTVTIDVPSGDSIIKFEWLCVFNRVGKSFSYEINLPDGGQKVIKLNWSHFGDADITAENGKL